MGIFDGYPFDSDSAVGPGWLGLALGRSAAGAPPQAVAAPVFATPPMGLALAPARADGTRAPARFSFLAPGVKRIDGRLTGEKFLQQFSPEVQAAVKAAIAGRAPTDATPRPGFAQAIAAIARKYRSARPSDAQPGSTSLAARNSTE